MTQFTDFHAAYQSPTQCKQPSAEALKKYSNLLPPDLIAEWKQSGWCAYDDGLLWTTDPGDFESAIDDWLDFDSGQAVVFLRTAFAHLYVWHEGFAYSFDPHRGEISQVTDDIDLMFTLLTDDDIRQKILRVDLFQRVKEKLGAPDRDECYAFVPALALGGQEKVENVQRVKLREHLALLHEIAGQ